jgi:hypothetical protein
MAVLAENPSDSIAGFLFGCSTFGLDVDRIAALWIAD